MRRVAEGQAVEKWRVEGNDYHEERDVRFVRVSVLRIFRSAFLRIFRKNGWYAARDVRFSSRVYAAQQVTSHYRSLSFVFARRITPRTTTRATRDRSLRKDRRETASEGDGYSP